MGKKKTEVKQNQDTKQSFNTSAETSVPDTPDIQAYRAWQPQTDPGLSYQYANARNRLNDSFNNPLGGYATPGMVDAQKRTANRQLNQDESQAFRAGAYDVNQQKAGQLGNLAQLTRGQKNVSSGTGTSNMTGTSTQTQSGISWGEILGAAAQVGAGVLTGGASTAATGALGAGKNRGTGGGGAPASSMSPSNPYGLPF